MSTEFLDKQFVKEFKQTMAAQRSQTSFSINMVPLENIIDTSKVDVTLKLIVKDVYDNYLSKLNDQPVDWIKKKTIERNIYWNSGEVKRKETYHVKQGSELIRTELNLAIPYDHKFVEEGFDYIDYKVDEDTNISYYYYTIPDKYLYPANETALVISERLKPKHYGGIKLINTDGYTFYMYVVTLKKLKAIDSQRIITTSISDQYTDLEAYLVDYWTNIGYIFNNNDLEVSIPVDKYDSTNLAYSMIDPTVEYEPGSDYSLAEQSKSQTQL